MLARCFNRSFCALGVIAALLPPASALGSFREEKLREIDRTVEQAIEDKAIPGAVLWIEHQDESYHRAFGNRALVPTEEPMTEDTLFDAASLTKVIACTPAVMLLVQRGSIDLDERVRRYLPEFAGEGREDVTVRQLMVHTSGLRGDIETSSGWQGQAAAIEKACQEKLLSRPGTVFRYSDINFFLLGEIVRRVSGTNLEVFVHNELFSRLGMVDTGYLPESAKRDRIAPTEVVNGVPFRGVVHDPTARKMGGVAGHAGLFTTAADLARFARMMLNDGELEGVRIFKPETVRLMTTVQTPEELSARRGLGWDIDSGYSGPRGTVFPLGSYGHTGWTGTSIWIDPFSRTFVILLSNRNHPTEDGNAGPLRAKLGTLAAEAVPDFNFAYVPGALMPRLDKNERASRALAIRPPTKTLNGVDVLAREHYAPLKGLRVGLITNHTGQDRNRRSTIDLLAGAPGVELKALFSPEHGIRGEADERLGDATDPHTGLPIFSLYGTNLAPTAAQLENLDALVFDIQDVGCRFYTYTATMAKAMEAAAANHKRFFVLDRVNPINGVSIDGPVLTGDATSFVGYHQVPLRYGMTAGELARMFKTERKCDVDLTVIPLENWHRDLWLDETGLPWTNPSPNLRSLTQATLYPGVGLLESALSVGRGTETPFEVVGAPYVDDVLLAETLTREGLPGIGFVPIRFTPKSSIYQGELCRGVQLVIRDRQHLDVVDVGLLLAKKLYQLYPDDFKPEKMERLLLDPGTLKGIKENKPLKDIRAGWQSALRQFRARRAPFLLYR